jgi:hypothetical protein
MRERRLFVSHITGVMTREGSLANMSHDSNQLVIEGIACLLTFSLRLNLCGVLVSRSSHFITCNRFPFHHLHHLLCDLSSISYRFTDLATQEGAWVEKGAHGAIPCEQVHTPPCSDLRG